MWIDCLMTWGVNSTDGQICWMQPNCAQHFCKHISVAWLFSHDCNENHNDLIDGALTANKAQIPNKTWRLVLGQKTLMCYLRIKKEDARSPGLGPGPKKNAFTESSTFWSNNTQHNLVALQQNNNKPHKNNTRWCKQSRSEVTTLEKSAWIQLM